MNAGGAVHGRDHEHTTGMCVLSGPRDSGAHGRLDDDASADLVIHWQRTRSPTLQVSSRPQHTFAARLRPSDSPVR